jgi:hypothetical protein
MADYFTNFSLVIALPDGAAQEYALELAGRAERIRLEDEQSDGFPASLKGVVEDWCFETDADSHSGKPGLWLRSSSGGIDAVCEFIRHLLGKFDPQGRVTFEWSNDCSKPRLDAYGGGAAIVTAHEIKTMNTGEWLDRHAA